jgi:hypothetical protein
MDRGREDAAAPMAAVFKNARLEIMVRLLGGGLSFYKMDSMQRRQRAQKSAKKKIMHHGQGYGYFSDVIFCLTNRGIVIY